MNLEVCFSWCYLVFVTHDSSPFQSLSQCLHNVSEWIAENLPQFNADKRKIFFLVPKM